MDYGKDKISKTYVYYIEMNCQNCYWIFQQEPDGPLRQISLGTAQSL